MADLTISAYLEKTASGEPVPGGGSIAALCAAAAAALTEMVANLTIGKNGYKSVESEMQDIAVAAFRLREKLVKDIDNDPQAYSRVIAAFKLPSNTEEEKKQRAAAIQDSFKQAALIPMSVAEDAFVLMELAEKAMIKGNKNALTDGAVAVIVARTAVLAGLYNVKINLTSIKDDAFVAHVAQKAQTLERQLERKEQNILAQIMI